MKKIIVHIYNILQVLWSSKVKFVSLFQLLGCPLFGSNFGLFSSRIYCLPCGDLLKKIKKMERRRYIKGEKEGVEQERSKERKNMLKERKK